MGVVSSNIFLNKDAPKYIPALATTAAFGGFGLFLTLLLGAWMIIDNAHRDRKQGVKLHARDVPTVRAIKEPARIFLINAESQTGQDDGRPCGSGLSLVLVIWMDGGGLPCIGADPQDWKPLRPPVVK